MNEIEITEIPPLSPGEQSLLDFHSVVNVLNVLHIELVMLGLNVANDGRGIPVDEIAEVVGFGMRASNVGEVRTLGGGFGLTKAFLVTKQFCGRFWIASAPGQGTQVRLWIPRPGAAVALKSEPLMHTNGH